MERFFKAYRLVVLCSVLYVQSVWSASETPITAVNCTVNSNCTKIDAHAMCGTGTPKKCTCKTNYKSNGNICVAKGLNDTCTDNEECVHVRNSTCDSTTSNKCTCSASFKANGAACAKRVVGDHCTQTSDCPTDAGCIANKTCSCNSGYISENGLCRFAVGTDCTQKTQCVTNAECDATTKKCACSSGFSASKGLCAKESSADSMKKTINAIVVSFMCAALLTII